MHSRWYVLRAQQSAGSPAMPGESNSSCVRAASLPLHRTCMHAAEPLLAVTVSALWPLAPVWLLVEMRVFFRDPPWSIRTQAVCPPLAARYTAVTWSDSRILLTSAFFWMSSSMLPKCPNSAAVIRAEEPILSTSFTSKSPASSRSSMCKRLPSAAH